MTDSNSNNTNQEIDLPQIKKIQKKKSQVIPAAFEELRQSISLRNSIIEYRRKLASIIESIRLESIGGHNNHLQHQPICEYEIKDKCDDDDLEAHYIQATKTEQLPMNKKDIIQNQIMIRDEHKVDLEILVKRYDTDIQNGHKQSKAEYLNTQLGDNKLSEKPKQPLIFKFLRELITPFAVLLWISSIICFVAYKIKSQNTQNLYFGIILIFVILITAFITFQQNKKSEAIMDSFKNYLPQKCVIIRDGSEMQINAEKLVLGDIVKIKAGEKIPADIRLIQVNEMKVDNSALTGESEPQIRSTFCSHPESLLETSNVAFFGTLCKEGQGIGIVIQIGDKTTLGEIAGMASSEKKTKTPLRIELDRLILFMVFVALSLGILFFLLSYFHAGYDAITSIVYGIGILVVNVPEGLVCCITISLAITAKSLQRKNVLVKNLESVETLGSTSCICSDKTGQIYYTLLSKKNIFQNVGTLTQNVMTVEHIWISGQEIRAINKKQVEDVAQLEYDERDISFKELHLNTILSSEAKFDFSQLKDKNNIDYLKCRVNGDATETGLIRFFQYIEDIQKIRDQYRIPENKEKNLARMPFNSTEKYALTIVERTTPTSDYCIYVKGAPEKIWNFCTYIQNGKKEEIINDEWDIKFEKANKKFGKSGERVIGFAKLNLPREQYPLRNFNFYVQSPKTFNFPLKGYVFTGLISLIDPPKTRVPNAILECRSAGIKVIMVTGDQPSTAASIAKNYFGFKTLELFGMATYSAYKPPAHLFKIDQKIDQFSQYQEYGVMFNSNVMLGSKTCEEDLYILKQNKQDFSWTIDWTQIENGKYDLRKAFIECKNGKWQSKVDGWSDCDIKSSYTYSDFTKNTACYSTDALKYAQSSFFCCIVIFQWSNIFACKARKSSFCTSPFNIKMIQGILFETCLAAFLVLTPGVNTIFGGRPIEFWQFGISGIPFSVMVLAWNEVRKYLIRKYRWFLKYSYW
ncbi:hypothetical protein ABPG73_008114 [Tetrahymena malaccensis]